MAAVASDMSVRPCSTFSMPSWRSVFMPAASAEADFRWPRAVADVLADGFVAQHQLVDAHAPTVAVRFCTGAALAAPQRDAAVVLAVGLAPACDERIARFGAVGGAALQVLRSHGLQRVVVGGMGLAALGAQAAHQALGQDGQQRVRKLNGSSPISNRRAMLSGAELCAGWTAPGGQ